MNILLLGLGIISGIYLGSYFHVVTHGLGHFNKIKRYLYSDEGYKKYATEHNIINPYKVEIYYFSKSLYPVSYGKTYSKYLEYLSNTISSDKNNKEARDKIKCIAIAGIQYNHTIGLISIIPAVLYISQPMRFCLICIIEYSLILGLFFVLGHICTNSF